MLRNFLTCALGACLAFCTRSTSLAEAGAPAVTATTRSAGANVTRAGAPAEQLDDGIKRLDVEAVKAALQAGADANRRGRLPIDMTVLQVQWMLSGRGSEGKVPDRPKEIETRGVAIIRALREKGAKVSPESGELLWVPAWLGLPNLADCLIDAGADPNALSSDGVPLIMATAIEEGHDDVLAVFLRRGGKPLAEKTVTQIKFVRAAAGTNVQPILAWLQKGADINATAPNGKTALVSACESWDSAHVVWFLLERGANPNATSKGAFVDLPLVAAISRYNLEVAFHHIPPSETESLKKVRLLLEYGADVSKSDSRHQTPLHWAALLRATPIAKALIDAGAKVMPKDDKGKTPLDYAESGPLIKLLKANGAKEQ